MTIFLILCLFYFFLPNFNADLKDLNQENKILSSTKILTEENHSLSLPQKYITTLHLIMIDDTDLKINDEYEKFWAELQDKNLIGKNVKYYTGIHQTIDSNPTQLEVNNKIIWTEKDSLKWVYIFFLLTLCGTVYSGIDLFKYLKTKYKQTYQ